jgi:SAM-dependent methyltransferase
MNFIPMVQGLIRESGFRSVMEVGGGRFPSFEQDEAVALGVDYTVNDISQRELSLAPDWVRTACFDIQTNDPNALAGHEGAYDLVYSKMVMEHVRSYRDAYRNIHTLLKPGGMAIAFHPTLYALPYVVNLAMPERLTAPLLLKLSSDRHEGGGPKFPAYYDGCVISRKLRDSLHEIGFSDVEQTPFYSHHYYNRIPVVRDIHRWISRAAASLRLTPIASYCFTIVRK